MKNKCLMVVLAVLFVFQFSGFVVAQEFSMLPLESGFYPIKIEYFQRGGEVGLNLLYVKPNSMQPTPIPFELLYSQERIN